MISSKSCSIMINPQSRSSAIFTTTENLGLHSIANMLGFFVTVLSLQAFFANGQVENVFSYLQHSGNHTTLVGLLKQSGLAGTLATSGLCLNLFIDN